MAKKFEVGKVYYQQWHEEKRYVVEEKFNAIIFLHPVDGRDGFCYPCYLEKDGDGNERAHYNGEYGFWFVFASDEVM